MTLTHNQFVTPEELAKLRLPLEEACNLPQAAYVSDHIFKLEAEHSIQEFPHGTAFSCSR